VSGCLTRWLLNILVIILTASLLQGFNVTYAGAFFGSIVLGIINAFIRPIILLLTLPLNILTLGLFTLIINGLMLWLTSTVVRGFDLSGFWTAVLAALIISLCSAIINYFVRD